MGQSLRRHRRQEQLQELLTENPFLTDEELARSFSVSVQTVRLDRLALGIPELRERTKAVARGSHAKVKSIAQREILGELVDLELGKRGISILETDTQMAFERAPLVRGHFLFAQAESLALAVVDAPMAFTGVVNVKYYRPVKVGERLITKAEIIRQRSMDAMVVLVVTRSGYEPVFRGKFLVSTHIPVQGEERA